MRKKVNLMLASVVLSVSLTACGNTEEPKGTSNEKTTNTSVESQTTSDISVTSVDDKKEETKKTESVTKEKTNGKFDIEEVRKKIVIKGQPFEIPIALKDLPEGWTYKEEKCLLGDGLGIVDMYYKGKEMIEVALENYSSDCKEESVIFNMTLETEDSSVDGLVPIKMSKTDVVDKFGKPKEIKKRHLLQYHLKKYINMVF